ncbi:hypothetical protein [Helicobacter sp.]
MDRHADFQSAHNDKKRRVSKVDSKPARRRQDFAMILLAFKARAQGFT